MQPDLRVFENAVADADGLLRIALEAPDWDERIRSRKTASYGRAYNYSGLSYAERPFPAWLNPVRQQLNSLVARRFNNCLLNLYADGTSGLGWHFDSYELLQRDSPVVIVSLGAERTLQFRSRTDLKVRWETPMQHGDALSMEASVQDLWLHRVPRASDSSRPRISLTFRDFR